MLKFNSTNKFTKNKKFIIFLIFILFIFLLEFCSRFIFFSSSFSTAKKYDDYSSEELNSNLPLFLNVNGGECIQFTNRFEWNQWWGYTSKKLDLGCAKELFKKKDTTIVFMGGSVMANTGAINYKTSIDYFATNIFYNFASINLAESGARHKNMSIRFQSEVIPLSPKFVFFLDGFNEFNSVRYGGEPFNDFYFTAGVRNRVHNPHLFFLEKIIEKSKFAEVAIVRTGIYKSSRIALDRILIENLVESAKNYLQNARITKSLCESYNIKCFFILQPQIFYSSLEEHKEIIHFSSSVFKHISFENLYGYDYIKANCEFCIDYSDLLKDVPNTFYDPVHFGKIGNYILGQKFKELIEKNK